MIRRFVFPLMVLALIGAVVKTALPDVGRYMKLRAM